MSFTLKSIELANIRVHEHILFEPAPTGITAISGENGSGKSTIVDSLAWVLYGTRVNNMKTSTMIREGVNPRNEPVYARATLIVSGIEYLVERKITSENGASECNVWGRHNEADEFVLLAGPSVSHVQAFIRQILKMDEQGFLASVLIQQKQVDQIVSASPRERGEVIEKLTGISSITESISMADEESRGLKRAVSLIHTGDLNEASQKVEAQKATLNKIINEEQEITEEYKDVLEKSKVAITLYKEEKGKLEAAQELKLKIESLETENRILSKQLEKDIEYVSTHRKKHGTVASSDINEIKKSRASYQGKLREARYQELELSNKINALLEDLKLTQNLTLDEVLEKESNHKKALSKLEADMLSTNERIQEVNEGKAFIKAEMKRIRAALKQIDGNELVCPVCKGEIHDPKHLQDEYNEEITKLKEDDTKLTKELAELNNSLEQIQASIKTEEDNIELYSSVSNKRNELSKSETELNEMKANTKDLEAKFNVIESQYETSLKIEADREALEKAKENISVTSEDIDKNLALIEGYKNEINVDIKPMKTSEFSKLEREAKALNSKVSSLGLRGKEVIGIKKLETERLKDYEENYNEVKETLDRYNSIASEIKVLTNTSDLLKEFKKARIEFSIPTLEFYASDILTKFTGGAFVKLSLDEKFNTTVTTSQGTVRPIAQLSGGELSAAAIALRLGISMFLNANEKSVLIFDEILVSMDEDRARHIMETISSLSNSQVIFIAHGSDINSVADKNVTINKK